MEACAIYASEYPDFPPNACNMWYTCLMVRCFSRYFQHQNTDLLSYTNDYALAKIHKEDLVQVCISQAYTMYLVCYTSETFFGVISKLYW